MSKAFSKGNIICYFSFFYISVFVLFLNHTFSSHHTSIGISIAHSILVFVFRCLFFFVLAYFNFYTFLIICYVISLFISFSGVGAFFHVSHTYGSCVLFAYISYYLIYGIGLFISSKTRRKATV